MFDVLMAYLIVNAWKFELCIVGIIISVLLPPLWAYVKAFFRPPEDSGAKGLGAIVLSFWPVMRPYVALGAARS